MVAEIALPEQNRKDMPIVPRDVEDHLMRLVGKEALELFGNLNVCPLTPRVDDEIQMVCMETAANLVERLPPDPTDR